MSHETIRKQLLARRHELNQRVHHIARRVSRADNPLPSDFSEQATERENDEVLEALGAAGRQELIQINRALDRIDAGEYGFCADCGAEIPERRLAALPFTTLCVRCAERRDRSA
jgi:RNA polymerase-binding protein DksA